MKEKNLDITELNHIIREKKRVQFYLHMLLGLSAGCGVMIPTDAIYTLLEDLSAQEASLKQKGGN
ncbi:hypothetical protein D3C75_1288440 [compost metagenome]